MFNSVSESKKAELKDALKSAGALAGVLGGLAAFVGGFGWVIDSGNMYADSLQKQIDQHVLKYGDGKIVCKFEDGKEITFDKPATLDEPTRVLVTDGLGNRTCLATLGGGPR